MPKPKCLSFYRGRELRIEQLDAHLWGCSCEVVPPGLSWNLWTSLGDLEAAKKTALITAQNLIGGHPHPQSLEWRDMSDIDDDEWETIMRERHHPREYPPRIPPVTRID